MAESPNPPTRVSVPLHTGASVSSAVNLAGGGTRAASGADANAAPSGVPAPSSPTSPAAAPAPPSAAHKLGFFGFFAITASMVMTVYEYPSFASSGLQLVFFLLVGGILWFLPVALCAAEMATVRGWESGGIFAWVGNTLGKRWGFAALFYQWFQITVGFVTMSFFILAALAYVVHWNALYNNPLVMFIGVAVIVWGLTLTQLGGTKLTERIAKVGFVAGILVPVGILLVGLIAYFATDGVTDIAITPAAAIPDFGRVDTLVIFASFILAYMGVEASASHVNELRNPTRTYPAVMIVLAALTIVLDAVGGMAVATTLPPRVLDGNLSFGVIEAFRAIFVGHFGVGFTWLVFAVALLLALGVLAEVSAWIVGPSRALLETANEGIIPPAFAKRNTHGVSVLTVVVQACLVTVWDAVLCGSIALAGGSSSSVGYLTAIGLTVVIYLVGYVLFFVGYLVLTLRHADLPRAFNVPGGRVGKVIVAACGLAVTLATLVISFFPSSDLDAQANAVYQATLAVSFAVSVAIPFVIYACRGHWAKPSGTGHPGAGPRDGANAVTPTVPVPAAGAACADFSLPSEPASPVASCVACVSRVSGERPARCAVLSSLAAGSASASTQSVAVRSASASSLSAFRSALHGTSASAAATSVSLFEKES